uniref:C3H1-type domain-containing protein n=1 Tax=Palpitomonas bilix TaxID=652834 RepID=A0A7S3G9I7_9EUKA|mmetsp:Transcript_41441/g.107363  ORF Transcript_41441/g.107363 Transcript_41441/m.107363 type:complete len:297 (+) Transcript_41441:331-1221(+)|eukprot:CAMPEP_0113876418 /NCGR_PEP_ID=MMETSP0780_2-20120614/5483_1 /TAXON_ID=652834 /ORGANISM="Palpitomonas bilix" /LENGTH=296 /DNA_ID=CAMNT_0000862509 /DNA_START=281 /DNA_END=1171 /DNA_ORIENTATION=+ /assembly_acc=CAM_ASM_000599
MDPWILDPDAKIRTLEFDIERFFNDKNKLIEKRDEEGICRFFQRGQCLKGDNCQYRHVKGGACKIVCKHWLRGLCKSGDQCDFLHEYDLSKMDKCIFFSKHGECSNEDCLYIHVRPEDKKVVCPWYERGFCRHGPNCRKSHMRKELCVDYLYGFCPKGPKCTKAHPRWEIPDRANDNEDGRATKRQKSDNPQGGGGYNYNQQHQHQNQFQYNQHQHQQGHRSLASAQMHNPGMAMQEGMMGHGQVPFMGMPQGMNRQQGRNRGWHQAPQQGNRGGHQQQHQQQHQQLQTHMGNPSY